MSSSLPTLDRVDEFLQTHNIDFLIPPGTFQGEVLLLQTITLMLVGYIVFKVSKI